MQQILCGKNRKLESFCLFVCLLFMVLCECVCVCAFVCVCVFGLMWARFIFHMVFVCKHRFYLGFDGFSAKNLYRSKPIATVFLVTNSESHISIECNIIILICFFLWSCIHCQWVCNLNFIFIIWAFHDTWIIQL